MAAAMARCILPRPFPALRRPLAPWLAVLLPLAHGATPPPGPVLLDATARGEIVIAVGGHGTIIRSADGGNRWGRRPAPTGATLYGVTLGRDRHAWAVGHGATVLRSSDGGETWERSETAIDPEISLLDVCAIGPGRALAVGTSGTVAQTNNGGQSWTTRRILEIDTDFNRITRTANSALFIAGDSGILLRSRDGGISWTALPSGSADAFHAVLPLADHVLLAYGPRGQIRRSTDGGESWKPVEIDGGHPLLAGTQLPDGTVVLAGPARAALASRDGGRTFRSVRHDLPAITRLLVKGQDALLAFGEAGVGVITIP